MRADVAGLRYLRFHRTSLPGHPVDGPLEGPCHRWKKGRSVEQPGPDGSGSGPASPRPLINN